jgi:hypothetical protein
MRRYNANQPKMSKRIPLSHLQSKPEPYDDLTGDATTDEEIQGGAYIHMHR